MDVVCHFQVRDRLRVHARFNRFSRQFGYPKMGAADMPQRRGRERRRRCLGLAFSRLRRRVGASGIVVVLLLVGSRRSVNTTRKATASSFATKCADSKTWRSSSRNFPTASGVIGNGMPGTKWFHTIAATTVTLVVAPTTSALARLAEGMPPEVNSRFNVSRPGNCTWWPPSLPLSSCRLAVRAAYRACETASSGALDGAIRVPARAQKPDIS